jgi:hypothetical protein
MANFLEYNPEQAYLLPPKVAAEFTLATIALNLTRKWQLTPR